MKPTCSCAACANDQSATGSVLQQRPPSRALLLTQPVRGYRVASCLHYLHCDTLHLEIPLELPQALLGKQCQQNLNLPDLGYARYPRSMQIAYLILAHAQPQQLGRLVERLAAPDVRFYVHIDANTPHETFTAMQSELAHRGIPVIWIARQPCRWGGFSLVAATLRLMEAALIDGCDWLVLLSGQDYPLKTRAAIARHLANTDKAGFIDLRDPESFDVRYRHETFHFERLNGKPAGKLLQKIQRTLNRLGIHRSPPAPLTTIRAGAQWWILSAPACRWVLDFCAREPQVMRFFQRTLVPDEMFFQTLLWHSPLRKQLCPDALRRIEWEPGAWSPRTFSTDDIPQLCAAPELFARKFSPDGKVSALLDASIEPS